ncbi:ABC transporter ATP-binding protein [Metamycoplasma buccale]|uniref:ABC transporter ATP-binding protein n=1 Tax=Metamycoplasma buccale TaxID=55602 RepID=UPI00398E5FC5
MNNAIQFVNITKEFPGIKANDDVSFVVKKGTIHALIGENGAGKSTLMSILFGLYEPTYGEILVNNNRVFFKGPNDANELGIGMVHQHFKLVDVYTNLDNIILGSEWTKKLDFLDRNIAIKKIKALQNIYNLHFDLFQKSGEATVSTQQKVEIMKMLYRDNEILIFDEPTAVLTDEEIQGLLKSFEIFKKAGKTILFISHKLKEIEQVADYATVLRHGKVAGNFDMKNAIIEDIVKAMVGSTVKTITNTSNSERKTKIFSLENVSVTKATKPLHNISFDIHAGEIFAIAGVEGNGQNELEKVCSGMIKPSFGKINLRILNKENNYEMKDITFASVYEKSKDHIAFIPADRHHHGLILDYDISNNSIMRLLWDKRFQKNGIINKKSEKKFTLDIIKKYDVRGAQEGKSLARSLSGGNQQKFIVGREIETPHDFIIIVQPTRGLDIGAINHIHQEILAEKAAGKAILLISYELDEVIALADTIAVINNGHILTIKDAKNISRAEIGSYMASSTNKIENKWWEANNIKEAYHEYVKFKTSDLKDQIEKTLQKYKNLHSSLYSASHSNDKAEIQNIKMQINETKKTLTSNKKDLKMLLKNIKNTFKIDYERIKN